MQSTPGCLRKVHRAVLVGGRRLHRQKNLGKVLGYLGLQYFSLLVYVSISLWDMGDTFRVDGCPGILLSFESWWRQRTTQLDGARCRPKVYPSE